MTAESPLNNGKYLQCLDVTQSIFILRWTKRIRKTFLPPYLGDLILFMEVLKEVA